MQIGTIIWFNDQDLNNDNKLKDVNFENVKVEMFIGVATDTEIEEAHTVIYSSDKNEGIKVLKGGITPHS